MKGEKDILLVYLGYLFDIVVSLTAPAVLVSPAAFESQLSEQLG